MHCTFRYVYFHGHLTNTLCMFQDPSSPPSPPSSRCGSPSKNTTSPALALYTGNASKPLNHHTTVFLYKSLTSILTRFIRSLFFLWKGLLVREYRDVHTFEIVSLLFILRSFVNVYFNKFKSCLTSFRFYQGLFIEPTKPFRYKPIDKIYFICSVCCIDTIRSQ